MNYVDHPFKSPSILSFCPGILGLERGLTRAIGPINVVAYVEIEAFIIANLLAGMEAGVLDPAPIWTDAKTFDARPFRGKLHGIIGGYPCPGESTAGLREGHLYKGFIWPAIRRAVAASRPLWCFFENVDDHLTGTFPIVYRSLRNMGYAVEAGIFTAEEAGAPHERKRLFILALADSVCTELQGRRKKQKPSGRGHATNNRAEMGNAGRDRHEQDQPICTGGNGTVSAGEELGNTNIEQSQGNGPIGNAPGAPVRGEKQGDGRRLEPGTTRPGPDLWPKGQGYEQYEWEAPRVESSMVYTTHGYNFREDLLRAIGNSVLEQTAEIAFHALIKKHNIKI